MINLNTETRLNIVHTGMNKALGEAIKNATPEQLESLREGKDIKSLLTSLLNDKLTSAKSDTIIIDILKNTPAFHTMGNFSETLATLLAELKTSPNLKGKSSVLENYFKNITTIDPQSLKHQIKESGVFMESKLAQAIQKIPDLIQTLEQLRALLSQSTVPESKTLQEKITILLQNPHLSSASQQSQSAAVVSETLKDIRSSINTLLSKTDPLFSKEAAIWIGQLEQHIEIKPSLSGLYGILLRSNISEADTFLDTIEKLLKNSSPASEELTLFTETLKRTVHAGDISKEAHKILIQLGEYTHPDEFLIETALKTSMQKDLKSYLLSLSEELKTATDPSAQKLLEHVDQLLMQIDYHQLTSYLNSSNSIYFPFAWDLLEEGTLAFKKKPDKKFYCQIVLRLKEYGELDLMMGLYEDNQLEMRIHTQKEELKSLIHEHLGELRSALIASGVHLRSIRVLHINEKNTYQPYENDPESDPGFEVTV